MSRTRAAHAQHLLAAVGVGMALLLSGCSLLPSIPTFGSGTTSEGSSDQAPTGDGGDGDTLEEEIEENPFLDSTIPETFPDVPTPDLEVLLGLDLGTGWSVVFKADDAIDDFNALADQYESEGWEQLARSAADDMGFGAYSTDDYQVQIHSGIDTTDYNSPIVTMTVVRRD